MWLDGAWRETRCPTKGEVGGNRWGGANSRLRRAIGQNVWGVLAKNRKYSEYLLEEGRQDRLSMKKFTDWVDRENISIVVKGGRQKLPNDWDFAAKDAVCSIWILGNFREKSRIGHFWGMLSMGNFSVKCC